MILLDKYRNIGFKLTPQRIAILDYLEGNTDHPSAENVYHAVINKYPTMSLATVYTTLGALKEKGNLVELKIDPDKKRYDPNTTNHDHVICISCKRIFDIPSAGTSDLPDSVRGDFSVLESHVEVRGLCKECQKLKEKNKEAVNVY